MLLVSVLVTLAALLAASLLWKRLKYDLHKVPSPPGLPFLGHVVDLMNGPHKRQFAQFTGSCLRRVGNPKLMRLNFMGTPWLIVTDSAFIKNVLDSATDLFPRYVEPPVFGLEMFGNDITAGSVVFAENPTSYTRAARRVFASVSGTSALKTSLPQVIGLCEKMAQMVRERGASGPIDVQELCVRLTLDIAGRVAFELNLGGLDYSGELHPLLIGVGRITRQRTFDMVKQLKFKYFPNCEEAKAQNLQIEQLTAVWKWIADEILKREDPPAGTQPTWYQFKYLKDPETGKKIPYKTLVAEVATLVVAAMDSTGHQLSWILAVLADNPDVVEAILEELKEHGLFGEGSRELAFEDLGELTYLTAVLKEAMRMTHPFLGVAVRYVPRDMTILGYRIPKGTRIVRAVPQSLNSEERWGDPTVFRPERWLTGEDMSDKWQFVFGTGPRDCAGQKLAMMELRVAVITFVRLFKFKMDTTVAELLKNSVDGLMNEAANGVWLHVTPRDSEVVQD